MTRSRPFLIAVLWFAPLVSWSSAHAVDSTRNIERYVRERWSADQGFPSGTVTALAQSKDGYLWIGTDKGLIRFDGSSFRSFPQASPSAVPIGPVQAMTADANGYLWVILQNTQIMRYYDGRFEAGHDETGFGITSIANLRDGTVGLSSLELGTLKYSADRYQTLTPGPPREKADDLSSRLSSAVGVAPHRFAEADSSVISMAETADGRIWLGTRDKGLFFLSQGKVMSSGIKLPGQKVNCLLAFNDRDLWIGTDNGLVQLEGDTIIPVPPALRHTAILSMIRDREGNLWVGTPGGLARVDGGDVSLATGDGPTHGSNLRESIGPVTALLEDANGDLWLGGSRGIACLRNSAVVTYSIEGRNSESPGAIYVDPSGRVWYAPIEGGLRWMRGKDTGKITLDSLDRDVTYSIAGNGKEMWLGRQHGGLTQLISHSGSVTAKTYTTANGLAQNSVYTVYETPDGTVWAGTVNGGVSERTQGKFITYTVAEGLASNQVSSIEGGPGATMWFGTSAGLSQLANGQWRSYTVRDGLPANNVTALFRDEEGILWIGTSGGLANLRSGRVAAVHEGQGALREPIMGLAADDHGNLWIATSHRVLRVRREPLLQGNLAPADLREYGPADGLHGTVGVKRDRSVVKDTNGRIWFSLNAGLSQVDPARASHEPLPPVVRVENVSADGNPLPLWGTVQIPAAQRRIVIDYSALSLASGPLRFRYRMDGFDHAWSEPVTTRQAIYTNLGPGSYSFRVAASNRNNSWDGAETAIPLEIAPVFWQTRWFQLSTLLALAFLTWLIYRFRLHQISRQVELRVEERANERARIARELHDSLLQGFQGMLLHLQVAQQMLPSRPMETREALEKVLDQGDQALAEARRAVQNLRGSPAVGGDLAQALAAMGKELSMSDAKAEFRVMVEGKPVPLEPILRDEVYRFAREALRNAFSHARAENIEAEITFADDRFLLRVRDDGIGVDPAVLRQGKRPGHWGLPGMRERAESIGASMELWSEAAAGTEVQLTVPAAVAYGSSYKPRGWRAFSKKRTPIL
jgi:ligand-binding sensor domain-containing protein/signal transduction histidine kinase